MAHGVFNQKLRT